MSFNELLAPSVLRDVLLETVHFLFLSRDLVLASLETGTGTLAVSEIHSVRITRVRGLALVVDVL